MDHMSQDAADFLLWQQMLIALCCEVFRRPPLEVLATEDFEGSSDNE